MLMIRRDAALVGSSDILEVVESISSHYTMQTKNESSECNTVSKALVNLDSAEYTFAGCSWLMALRVGRVPVTTLVIGSDSPTETLEIGRR